MFTMFTSSQGSRGRLLAVVMAVAACTLAGEVRGQPVLPREFARIELPGVDGRLDHLAIDAEGQRLFVAALGADKIEVIDLKAGRRMAELTGVREPQGAVFVPTSRRLLVAGGESGDVVAFSEGRRVAVASGLPDADNLRFFAPTGQLFAGFGSGLAAIDPVSLAVTQRITAPITSSNDMPPLLARPCTS